MISCCIVCLSVPCSQDLYENPPWWMQHPCCQIIIYLSIYLNATNMKFKYVNRFFKGTKLLEAPTLVVTLFVWWPMIGLQLSVPCHHRGIIARHKHNLFQVTPFIIFLHGCNFVTRTCRSTSEIQVYLMHCDWERAALSVNTFRTSSSIRTRQK